MFKSEHKVTCSKFGSRSVNMISIESQYKINKNSHYMRNEAKKESKMHVV